MSVKSIVDVGVDVNVGRGVSDGWGVNVSVGDMVGCTVSVTVGVGSGLIVQVGSIIGVDTGWINVNPPHPIDKSAIADIAMNILCKRL